MRLQVRPARPLFNGRASNGGPRPDNRLSFVDHALFAAHNALGVAVPTQCV